MLQCIHHRRQRIRISRLLLRFHLRYIRNSLIDLALLSSVKAAFETGETTTLEDILWMHTKTMQIHRDRDRSDQTGRKVSWILGTGTGGGLTRPLLGSDDTRTLICRLPFQRFIHEIA
jgi:hypothetical protein